jgi:hypothetical protein
VNSGLQVIDISDPINPNIIGSYNRQAGAPNIFVSGVYAYFTDTYDNGEEYLGRFQVLNISDPTLPAYWGASFYVHSALKDIFIEGTYAYVIGGQTLWIFNIDDHSNPQFIIGDNFFNDPHSLYISSSYAYVADGDFGLKIVNISDPTNPSIVDNYYTQNFAWDVRVDNNYIYLTDYDAAPNRSTLLILRLNSTGTENIGILPQTHSLPQNYPNPFNAATTISYTIPTATKINLDIYDLLGRKMTTLLNEYQQAGHHQAIWNAKDTPSGVYFYRLQAGEKTETNKMLLLK